MGLEGAGVLIMWSFSVCGCLGKIHQFLFFPVYLFYFNKKVTCMFLK